MNHLAVRFHVRSEDQHLKTIGSRFEGPRNAGADTNRVERHGAGVGVGAVHPPRIHDLRHTFAIRALLGWHRDDADVQARLPWLAAYLGHREPRYTYHYLSAAPELLGHAARLLEHAQAAAS